MIRFNILFLLAILVSGSCKIFSQEKINSSFELSGDKILIYYELKGDVDQDYNVSVVLKRTSLLSFEYTPSELHGDVGIGKFAGGKKTITWNLNKKESEIFSEGDDYYFQVKGAKISSGGSSWLYYTGGVILGGGAAALLLLKKKNTTDSVTPVATGLASPPGRP